MRIKKKEEIPNEFLTEEEKAKIEEDKKIMREELVGRLKMAKFEKYETLLDEYLNYEVMSYKEAQHKRKNKFGLEKYEHYTNTEHPKGSHESNLQYQNRLQKELYTYMF